MSEDRFAKFRVPAHPSAKIQKIIGVGSGKGGVGKSTVTSLLAVALMKAGKKVGIMDADITGPSIPRIFGIKDKAVVVRDGMLPAVTENGIKIISMSMLLPHEDQPAVWRGPVISNMLQQFAAHVKWGELDVLLIDLPPGTGDVPLSICQMIRLDGMLIVTTPQGMVSVIVSKAINMAKMMDVPVVGAVENFAAFRCPQCGTVSSMFGDSKTEKLCSDYEIPYLGQLVFDPRRAELCDRGEAEKMDVSEIEDIINKINME